MNQYQPSKIFEVVVSCAMQKACSRELEELPQQKPHLASPIMENKMDVLIDGYWKAMDRNCLIEIKRAR